MAIPVASFADEASACTSAAALLLRATAAASPSHYLLAALLLVLVVLCRFLEIHLLRDLLRGLRGDPVALTFDPASEIYQGVASKCRSIHGRYLATPWLASPHFQTAFLNFFGRPPSFTYRRQLFTVHDGGTIALDWLLVSDVAGDFSSTAKVISKDDTTPLVVIIPGLTSDSAAAYVKHLAYSMASHGWNVVVSNHRGLAGMSITSDCFYNAGWTEDVREVVNYLHREHPKAPLFAVGTSIGANILVKYLGEDGENTPVAGAASICSPWDLVVCDRFISRKLVQRCYDRALTIGLKGYAQLHQPILSRLANWEGIRKSRSVRDFDNHATCLVGKFETVDTYYRRCSSVSYIGNVSVPLLCISALDDPVCTREAIPWDECRANKNIVLATTAHGGHLAFFEGLTAKRLWWVGAVREFLSVLHYSPYMHGQKKTPHPGLHSSLESSIDKSPYVNIMEDGMVAAVSNDAAENKDSTEDQTTHETKPEDFAAAVGEQHETGIDASTNSNHCTVNSLEEKEEKGEAKNVNEAIAPLRRSVNQLSRRHGRSMWLFAYIAVVSSWPLLGSLLFIVFRKKFMNLGWFTR
ncbi:embryogenesis-associated protein EMB8 [Ananas comosus]|uniref:Embryogenesis-associated protein EMB8 n=1 Tax=Ananas comosus TaxID=4615 RepID=A0A199W0X1_ANACO|nr:embryogenesis-associated protein EMB8 [Ananas comosus]OAY82863.1 Embryogenesis-associated protein EMB8 [Ananas comosus]